MVPIWLLRTNIPTQPMHDDFPTVFSPYGVYTSQDAVKLSVQGVPMWCPKIGFKLCPKPRLLFLKNVTIVFWNQKRNHFAHWLPEIFCESLPKSAKKMRHLGNRCTLITCHDTTCSVELNHSEKVDMWIIIQDFN